MGSRNLGHFWRVFICNPNLSSSRECYSTYRNVQNWAVLWCGLLRKLGGSDLGFKVFSKSNINLSNSDAFPLAFKCSPIVMFFCISGYIPFFPTIILSRENVKMASPMCCISMEDIHLGEYNILFQIQCLLQCSDWHSCVLFGWYIFEILTRKLVFLQKKKFIVFFAFFLHVLVKGRAVPLQAWSGPEGSSSQITWQQHRIVVRLSALRTSRLYPQEMLLVLISVTGCVDLRAIVRSEGLCQWKIPMTPSGIEPATFRFVVQYLNHCTTAVPLHVLAFYLKRSTNHFWPHSHHFILFQSL
jgi:hypothetical protein